MPSGTAISQSNPSSTSKSTHVSGSGPGVAAHLASARDGHLDLSAEDDLDTFGRCREHAERRARRHAFAEERVELVDEDRTGLVDACMTKGATGGEQLVDRGATATRQREQRDLAEARDEPLTGHHGELQVVEANGGHGHRIRPPATASAVASRAPRQ